MTNTEAPPRTPLRAHLEALPGLDRNGDLPYYAQIKERLRAPIQAGRWPEGTLLPTEAQLQVYFGVSRTTVRQALADLEAEGYIVRHPGRGTFVASPQRVADRRPRRLVGFLETLRARGVDVQSEVRGVRTVRASSRVAASLALPPGSPVTEIRHRSLVHGQPIAVSRTYMVCAGDLDAEDIRRKGALLTSLREHWDRVHREPFRHARRVTTATLARPEEAQLLQVDPGSALVLVRLYVNSDRRPVVYLQALYRADRYEYEEFLEA
jgi:GntR family transcriptional regulator